MFFSHNYDELFFANFVNNYCLKKQNLKAYYDPEIVRGVFYVAYFVMLMFSTYWRLSEANNDVWSYIFQPPFLTFIAYDAVFHRDYIINLENIRELDRTMLKHF